MRASFRLPASWLDRRFKRAAPNWNYWNDTPHEASGYRPICFAPYISEMASSAVLSPSSREHPARSAFRPQHSRPFSLHLNLWLTIQRKAGFSLMSGTLKPWKVLRSEVSLETPWFTIRRDVCETAENTLVPEYYTWQKRDCVIVFPITIDQNVLLIKQYRHGLRHITIDYPGGTIEADQSLFAAAASELLEETGYRAKNFIPLGSYSMDSSYSSQRAHFVVGLDCEFAVEAKNPNEITEVFLVPIALIGDFASQNIDCLLCALLTLKAMSFMKEKEK